MHIKAPKKEFLKGLQRVVSVTVRRTTAPILENIYLQASDGRLTMRATDLDISVETSIPVEVSEEGCFTIVAKRFFEIMKELPDEEVEILSKENYWVSINCGAANFNIMGCSPEDFPTLPDFSMTKAVPIYVKPLEEMLSHTLFAVSTDETRYHLNGIYLDKGKGNKYFMVATDSHRLTYCEKELFETVPNFWEKGIIIPRKGAQELKKLLDINNENWMVFLKNNHLIFNSGDTNLYVRLIEGNFPDYKKVVPEKSLLEVEMNKEELLVALRRMSLLVSEKTNAIKLSISKNEMEISTSNPDMGTAREKIKVGFTGDSMEIGFNLKYLMDSINGFSGEKATLFLNDSKKSGVIKISGNEGYFCVLMPMRL